MTEQFKKGAAKLDENTSVSLKILIPLMSSFLVGGLWFQGAVRDLKADILASGAKSESEIRQLRQELQETRQEVWSSDSQRLWSNELRARNPSLQVPYAPDFGPSRPVAIRPR